MPVTISGNNITVPGYVYLTNPLIGVNRVLAVDPAGAINVTQITVEQLDQLSAVSVTPVADTLVKRDAFGGGQFVGLSVTGVGGFYGGLIAYGDNGNSQVISILLGAGDVDCVGINFRGRDGQTSNYFQWSDPDNTPIGWIDASGKLCVESFLFVDFIHGTAAGKKLVCQDSGGNASWQHDAYDGELALGNGVSSGSVTGLTLPFTPSRVFAKVRKPSGGLNISAFDIDGTLTDDGFDFDLDGTTDSSNYILDYVIYP